MTLHGDATAPGTRASRANIALGLGVLAVILYVIAMLVAQDGSTDWLWPVAGLVGAVAAVVGWLAGRPRPSGRALLGIVLGGLVFLVILGWVLWAASTGNF